MKKKPNFHSQPFVLGFRLGMEGHVGMLSRPLIPILSFTRGYATWECESSEHSLSMYAIYDEKLARTEGLLLFKRHQHCVSPDIARFFCNYRLP